MSGGRPRKIYRETVEAAAFHRSNGLSWAEIAGLFGVDRETIARAVRRGSDAYPPAPGLSYGPPVAAKLDSANPGGVP